MKGKSWTNMLKNWQIHKFICTYATTIHWKNLTKNFIALIARRKKQDGEMVRKITDVRITSVDYLMFKSGASEDWKWPTAVESW